jgi:CheY-like chemotaxis protein
MHGTSCGKDGSERRRRRRARLSLPIRVRREMTSGGQADDVSTTLDVSRNGVQFITACPDYLGGMKVSLTLPYSRSALDIHAGREGRVVRVRAMNDGRKAVAVVLDTAICAPTGIRGAYAATTLSGGTVPGKPLVMVVDGDPRSRLSVSHWLIEDGYEVIAVRNSRQAQHALETLVPELLIAEVEGEGLSGSGLCAHLKAKPRFWNMQIVLLTNLSLPDDCVHAHALGAAVCIAKPVRQERLRQVLQLLLPTSKANGSHYSAY